MCAKWNTEVNSDVVVKEIAQIASLNEEGKAVFKAFGIHPFVATLTSALEFNSDIPLFARHQLAYGGICDAVKPDSLDKEHVLQAVKARESNYLRQPKKPYVLLTCLSAQLPAARSKIRLGKDTINLSSNFPRTFSRKPIMHLLEQRLTKKAWPTDYAWVRVQVSGRGWREAGEKAIDLLDTYRGIWNLWSTFRRYRISFSSRGPVNDIVLGPFYTIHAPNGKLAVEDFWYEASYIKPQKVYKFGQRLKDFRIFQRQVLKTLRESKKPALLFRLLCRYARSQDGVDLGDAFLKLWSVLETLTVTEKNSYDTTIRRAAALSQGSDYHRQELKHLRLWRNRRIHRNESSDEIETHVYQLKQYVDQMLRLLLLDPEWKKRPLAEMMELLDLPQDDHEIHKKMQLYKSRLKLWKSSKKKA